MTHHRLIATLVAWPAAALANHGAPAPGAPQTILVQGHYDNAVGTSDAASAGSIRGELLKNRPAQRPGEVLEFVPGVVVTQHSGDGKANQYFLRGFNLDHGTDFATRIDGMPVNLPSHGHGQGYSDLNFLIPELVARIDYRKGPYAAEVGDFGAVGSADIRTLTRVAAPFGQLTLGGNGFRRGLLGGSAEVAPGITALAALALMRNDGPWTVPERLRKHSALLTLSGSDGQRGWQVSAMDYRARWTATDQVPQRLIDAGTFNGQPFGRFDSLDPTAGGASRRSSLSGQWHQHTAGGRSTLQAYAIRHTLDLNSNFTYALERPDSGDQFKQTDARSVWGLEAEHSLDHALGPWPARTTLGVQLRHDNARVGLHDSQARRITTTVRQDAVRQTQAALYASSSIELSPTLRAVLGLRADHLQARVQPQAAAAAGATAATSVNGGRASAGQLSPKLSLVWAVTPRTELFFNAGRGLHSNDARGMTARLDPRSGEPVDAVPPLVPVAGAELGLRTEAVAGLQTSVALWGLRSASELVYIGDAGNTEASLGSRRRGIEVSQRWAPAPWLLVDADLAFSHARLDDGSRVPNAVDRVASLAATLRQLPAAPGWSSSLQLRHRGPGALSEDNQVRAQPATTVNWRITRELGPQASLTLDVFNLFDRRVDDIQYAYTSRLPGEDGPVAGRHVHPAEPRSLRLTLQARY